MPRQRGGLSHGTHLLDRGATIQDWTPPGWHWEVLSSGARILVRNPGDIVDPDLVWWVHHAPGFDQREPAAEEDVQRRIGEEDQHVHRYMCLLQDPRAYRGTWQFLQRVPNPRMSYLPVKVPSMWVSCARRGPRGMGPIYISDY
jgi:hypothetical protein